MELHRGDYNSSSNFRLFFCGRTKAFSSPPVFKESFVSRLCSCGPGDACLKIPIIDTGRVGISNSGVVFYTFFALPPFLVPHIPSPAPQPCAVFNKKNAEAAFSRQEEISCFLFWLIKCAIDLWNYSDFLLQISNSRGRLACLWMHFLCTARQCERVRAIAVWRRQVRLIRIRQMAPSAFVAVR